MYMYKVRSTVRPIVNSPSAHRRRHDSISGQTRNGSEFIPVITAARSATRSGHALRTQRFYFLATIHVTIGQSGSFFVASRCNGCHLACGIPSARNPSFTTDHTSKFPQPPNSIISDQVWWSKQSASGVKRQKSFGTPCTGFMKHVV